MRLRLIHLAIPLSAALLLLSGCSAGIIAVEELPEMAVTAGTSFDTLQLPAQVTVTFKNGASGKAAVKWDTAEWAGEEVHESITVIGKVAGAKELATLPIKVEPVPTGIWEWPCFAEAVEGTLFDAVELPIDVGVHLSDHSEGRLPVTWDVGTWPGKRLDKTITITGKVDQASQPATLVITVLPQLTVDELASSDVVSRITRKLESGDVFHQLTWSPGQDKVAFTVGADSQGDAGPLYIWQVDSPVAVSVRDGLQWMGFYHGLAWSHDGKYLAVHEWPGAETKLYIVDTETLKVVYSMGTWNIGYWSPDSPEYLVASLEGGKEPTFPFALPRTTDLVLINAASGARKVLLEADSDTLYSPQGWKAPGQALYTRNYKGEATQDLVISTRP